MSAPVTTQPAASDSKDNEQPPPGYGPPPPPGYGSPPSGYGQPPPVGYAPPLDGYAPPQGGYASPPGGYAPPQGGYAPPPGGYAPPPGGYAPPPGGYTPSPGGYAPQPGGYALQPGAQGSQQWMTRPTVSNCPPGLEYLTTIDQILVKQQVEILEVLSGFECANKYIIVNSVGQQVYFAGEESNLCMRQCCGSARGFVMHISDNMAQEVMRITREFKCCAGCCWCACCEACALEIVVEKRKKNTEKTLPTYYGCPDLKLRRSCWLDDFTFKVVVGGGNQIKLYKNHVTYPVWQVTQS
uniref:Phospholipid scramblase n=1 Tax=Octopus bimaculoides TaxID=37653 RepID=A0A0L8HNZ1_OCTBM